MDPDWIRWIYSAFNVHFAAACAAAGLPLLVEGVDRRTDDLVDYAEVRYTGPRFAELSRGYWRADVDVDVLVASKTNNLNIYTFERSIGVVLAAFVSEIAVFRLGGGPADDPLSLLGCLTLVPANGGIAVTNFGYPKDQVRLRQASVEATYRIDISF